RTSLISIVSRQGSVRAGLLLVFVSACAAEVTEKDRIDARLQYDMGVEQLAKGNTQQALGALATSERLDGAFPDLHNALGLVYASMGRYDDSEKHFLRALELKPDYSDVHNNLGTLY